MFDMRTLDNALACVVQFVYVGPLAIMPVAFVEAAHLINPHMHDTQWLLRYCNIAKIVSMIVCMQVSPHSSSYLTTLQYISAFFLNCVYAWVEPTPAMGAVDSYPILGKYPTMHQCKLVASSEVWFHVRRDWSLHENHVSSPISASANVYFKIQYVVNTCRGWLDSTGHFIAFYINMGSLSSLQWSRYACWRSHSF